MEDEPKQELTPELVRLKEEFEIALEDISTLVDAQFEIAGVNYDNPIPIEAILEFIEQIEEGQTFVEFEPERQQILIDAISEKLGVDFKKNPSYSYSFEGPDGSPGEGKAEVEVFETDQEGVGVHRITYADGKIGYAFGLPKPKEE